MIDQTKINKLPIPVFFNPEADLTQPNAFTIETVAGEVSGMYYQTELGMGVQLGDTVQILVPKNLEHFSDKYYITTEVNNQILKFEVSYIPGHALVFTPVTTTENTPIQDNNSVAA